MAGHTVKESTGSKMIPDFKCKGDVHAMLEKWSAPSIILEIANSRCHDLS